MSPISNPPWPLAAAESGAQLVRLAQQSMLGGTGVLSGGEVTHVSGKLEVEVAPFAGYIPGTSATDPSVSTGRVNAGSQHGSYASLPEDFLTQGSYFAYLAEAEKLAVATPSSEYARIDLVCAYVEDAEYEGSTNECLLGIVTGTAASSPVAPVPPKNCLVLAEYTVEADAVEVEADHITDKRPFASAGLATKAVTGANLGSATVRQETGTTQSFLSWGAVTFAETTITATVAGSEDWTARIVSKGQLLVTWDKVKTAKPIVILGCGQSGGGYTATVIETTTAEFQAVLYNSADVVANGQIFFVALASS